MRVLIKSEFEMFIIYGAIYMKEYPEWYELERDNMIKYMMKESKGQMNPYVLKDKVNELYRSVGVGTKNSVDAFNPTTVQLTDKLIPPLGLVVLIVVTAVAGIGTVLM